MWDNIGGKIKILAKVIACVGIIASIIGGIVLISTGTDMRRGGELYVGLGLGSMFIGTLISWISAWFMYGFGELIEKTTAIEKNTRNGNFTSEVTTNALSSDNWICNKCNHTNRKMALFCNSCGEKK
jgi:membrane-bound ClpP family serine protease